MKMFLGQEEHAEYLSKCVADNPKTILISSFGIYAGITYAGQDTTEWGEKYKLETRVLMNKIRSLSVVPDTRLLIGIQEYKSCKRKQSCIDCERQYCKTIIRLMNHASTFPEFKWRMSTKLHLKACLFFYDKSNDDALLAKGVSGGRNFTDSDWLDCTFELDVSNIRRLGVHINEIWKDSVSISEESIENLFEQQGISELAVTTLT